MLSVMTRCEEHFPFLTLMLCADIAVDVWVHIIDPNILINNKLLRFKIVSVVLFLIYSDSPL